jgi:death-on-curing protein
VSELRYPRLGDAIALNAAFATAPVRDVGLLQAALARPQATVLGRDAYPGLWAKAAALLHGIVSSHPFIDGNKRTGLALAVMLLGRGGADVSAPDHDALFDLVVGIAQGGLREVPEIEEALKRAFGV